MKALVGVGPVSENPVNRLPHRSPFVFKNLRPVRHEFLRWLKRSILKSRPNMVFSYRRLRRNLETCIRIPSN